MPVQVRPRAPSLNKRSQIAAMPSGFSFIIVILTKNEKGEAILLRQRAKNAFFVRFIYQIVLDRNQQVTYYRMNPLIGHLPWPLEGDHKNPSGRGHLSPKILKKCIFFAKKRLKTRVGFFRSFLYSRVLSLRWIHSEESSANYQQKINVGLY
jgi:hypothetical protein